MCKGMGASSIQRSRTKYQGLQGQVKTSGGEQLCARGPRSSSDQDRLRSIVSVDISEKKQNAFSKTNCFVIDPIAQEQSIKYHNKDYRFSLLGFMGKQVCQFV